MFRSKDQIEHDVKEQFKWDDRVGASNINVEIEGSTVKLKGTVHSSTAYKAAEFDALTVPGVSNVDNQLRVVYPDGVTVPADDEIASDVKSVLALNPNIDALLIDVIVSEGMVTLKGKVDAYWKKQKADDLASDVRGVIGVINELEVEPSQDYLDEMIEGNIKAALKRNDNVDEDSIIVSVVNGIVTLRGNVPNWYAARAANDTALYTRGVVDVKSYLEIESGS